MKLPCESPPAFTLRTLLPPAREPELGSSRQVAATKGAAANVTRPNFSNHSRLYPPSDRIDEGLGVAEEFELVEVSGFGA